MPSLRKLTLPVTIAALATGLLLPTAAGAQARICKIQPNHPVCKSLERRQEIRDRQNGVTPACRAAADRYSAKNRTASILKSSIPEWKKAVKKAKSDKAKKKAKKGLKKARKQHKKAAKSLPGLKAGMESACASARVKPY